MFRPGRCQTSELPGHRQPITLHLYDSLESGRLEVKIKPLPAGEGNWQVLVEGWKLDREQAR